MLTSYGDIAAAEDYKWPHAIMLPYVLKQFDLPDCYTELKSENIKHIEPWGAMDGMQA